MTTVPARSLSGDHLGKAVRWESGATTYGGELVSVDHDEARLTSLIGFRTAIGSYTYRAFHPDTPVTIEDTE